MTDPLDRVLQLVASGRLTADEAAPILEALEAKSASGGATGSDNAEAEPLASGPTNTTAKSAPRRHSGPSGGADQNAPSTACGAIATRRAPLRRANDATWGP